MRKVATKISRCIAFNKLVRCASPGQVNQQFAMADGFDNRCLSCSERWREAFGRLSFEDFGVHANTRAGVEDLAQYENTKAGTEPDWIPEDVLAETPTRVCVERSLLVLTAAEYRKEMVKPLPGAGRPELPTMILLSKQNPGENEEHFVFQDPDHRYRRAAVKQELADVRRSHRFDVHRNAHERRRSKSTRPARDPPWRSFQSRASSTSTLSLPLYQRQCGG